MRRFLAAATVFVMAATAAPAMADTLRNDLEAVGARIEAVTARIEAAAGAQSALATDILTTRDRMTELRQDLERVESELGAVQDDLDRRQNELERVRVQLQNHYQLLARTRSDITATAESTRRWARETYMAAGFGAGEVVFDVGSLTDVSLGVGYLERITERGEESLRRLEALEQQEDRQRVLIEEEEAFLADEVAGLEDLRGRWVTLQAALEVRTAEVSAELSHQQGLLARLEAEETEHREELEKLEREQERIEREIAAAQSSGGSAPGVLVRPVPGTITSGFGPRKHPILGYVRTHTGIDMSASRGDPIKAAGDGTVILAGWYGGYGNTIVIDHGGGMTTLYAHQSSLGAGKGDTVTAGSTIGYIGSTGLSTGPHLHFEVRINSKPVDPAPYL